MDYKYAKPAPKHNSSQEEQSIMHSFRLKHPQDKSALYPTVLKRHHDDHPHIYSLDHLKKEHWKREEHRQRERHRKERNEEWRMVQRETSQRIGEGQGANNQGS